MEEKITWDLVDKIIEDIANKIKESNFDIDVLKEAKRLGFSDKYIAQIWNKTEKKADIFLLKIKDCCSSRNFHTV